jgi:hypothetical protein
MIDNIFNSLISKLNSLSVFAGGDGTFRVYDYPIAQPDGYPYAVIGSKSIDGSILDNARDLRLYGFVIQIVGEKFGEQAGFTQSLALKTMRQTGDIILSAIDADTNLSNANIVRVVPIKADFAFTDNASRVVLTIELQAQVTVDINYTRI